MLNSSNESKLLSRKTIKLFEVSDDNVEENERLNKTLSGTKSKTNFGMEAVEKEKNLKLDFPRRAAGKDSPQSVELVGETIEAPKNNVFHLNNVEPDAEYRKLMDDVEIVRKYVAHKSREEILAYLEAYYASSHRVPIVISELLETDELSLNLPDPVIQSDDDCIIVDDDQPSTSGEQRNQRQNEQTLESRVADLLEVFPDADGEFFLKFLEENINDPEKINETATSWLENRNYPKLEDKRKIENKKKLQQRNFTVAEYLEVIENPDEVFQNISRAVDFCYKTHATIYLQNEFPYAYKSDIQKTLQKHNYHLYPALKELREIWSDIVVGEPKRKRLKTTVKLKCKPTPKTNMPENISEAFYKELAFIELEPKITAYKEAKKKEREEQISTAKQLGALMTCHCCFEDDLIIDDMLPCEEGHLFCRNCIRQQSEVNIGLQKFKFPCLNGYCDAQFHITILQQVLKPTVYSNLMSKMQAEEIRQADIADLESCPHCSFSAIITNQDDKIFKCLNPECLKETCRLCKEPNHIPLRCNEIEKQKERQMRTFIEDRMTEALLRKCDKCNRSFIKEDGCNKMTCTCGRTMCYVCRKCGIDYNHFTNGNCPQYSDDRVLHDLEVEIGAKKAKEEYVNEHPELRDMKLKHDPTKVKNSMPTEKTINVPGLNLAMPVLNEQGQITFERPQPHQLQHQQWPQPQQWLQFEQLIQLEQWPQPQQRLPYQQGIQLQHQIQPQQRLQPQPQQEGQHKQQLQPNPQLRPQQQLQPQPRHIVPLPRFPVGEFLFGAVNYRKLW